LESAPASLLKLAKVLCQSDVPCAEFKLAFERRQKKRAKCHIGIAQQRERAGNGTPPQQENLPTTTGSASAITGTSRFGSIWAVGLPVCPTLRLALLVPLADCACGAPAARDLQSIHATPVLTHRDSKNQKGDITYQHIAICADK